MLKNYLKIALRSLRKQKLYAFINIFSLAVGIAFCALIFLYVRDELTYDNFHEKKDRIFRVHQTLYEPDGSVRDYNIYHPTPLGPALQADFPEVERFVRFTTETHFIRHEELTLEEEVLYADAAVLDVFTFPLERGNPATALADLNSVILSPDAARKYFGTTDVVGKPLSIRLGDRFEDFTVTGLAREIPSNSSIRFDFLLPFPKRVASTDWVRESLDMWNRSFLLTYVELAPDASAATLAAKFAAFWRKYNQGEIDQLRREGRWSGDGIPSNYGLMPIEQTHLSPQFPGGLTPASKPIYSYILAGIALAVLLIACINFTTLAIGRSASRSREIGIRKVVGAKRSQLMRQFWGEALLLSVLALIAGVALAEMLLPVFNQLTGKGLRLDVVDSWTTLAGLAGILLVTALVAGSYPALVLSGFRPVETLKSRLKLSGSNVFTQSLVVLQFALVVFLVIGTLAMLRQLDYVRSKDLGFDKEHVVVIPTNDIESDTALRLFRNELGNRSSILGITGADISFSRGYTRTGFMYDGQLRHVYEYGVEVDYLDVLDIPLLAGRNFNPNLSTDSTHSAIVNEAMVREFGWSDPIGQVITGYDDEPGSDPVVIGVVEDFNLRSLHEEVEPTMLRLEGGPRYILVRIAPQDVSAAIEVLRTTWQEISPDLPFDHAFLDDDLNTFYESEQRWSRIIGYAAFFAILIACLGMFGLAALITASRTKEIGIRKVLGASVTSITVLLSRGFARLVLIAIVLAVPAAYYATSRWLENFAYRIEIGPDLFLLAGGLALLIALLTVSYQSIKAALSDPVKSLRYE